MNKARRKKIADLRTSLETLKENLDLIRDEEQEAFEAMPESIQGSEKGTDMEEGLESLSDVFDELESVIDRLESFQQ